MAKSRVLNLILVYDFKKSPYDYVITFFGKTPSNHACVLSQLTSWKQTLRPEWDYFSKKCSIPISYQYLNTISSEIYHTVHGKTPCVVAKCTHNQYILLLDCAQISRCADVYQFQNDIFYAIDKKFLTF